MAKYAKTPQQLLAALVIGAGAILVSAPSMSVSQAHEITVGTLTIDHPVARPTPPVARNGAVFMVISDLDGDGDTLLSASTPNAARTEIHRTSIKDNIAKMERVETVPVAAGDAVVFEPGGLHVMLMGLKGPLIEGESFPLTLTFENAGPVEIEVKIENPQDHGEADKSDDHSGHH